MIRFVGRRARAQWPLLAALLAVVAIGATLLGTCALLVTRTGERALEVVAARADPDDTRVTAFTVDVKGRDARSVAADTRAVLAQTLRPFASTTAARASSAIRTLPSAPEGNGSAAETYLAAIEDLPSRARLVDGRWPGAAGEAVILESTARVLGLAPGNRVALGAELRQDPAGAVEVTVVGVVRPLAGAGWDRDPLGGAGYDFAFQDGRSLQPVHAYGPFLVGLDDLLAGASTIDRLEVTARPDLGRADRADLDAVTASIAGADRRLDRTLGERVRIQRVESFLPATMRQAREQQQVTAAAVLAVAVVGGVLTATALALAGRLTAGVRATETDLLSALGTSRRQFAAAAGVEALVLAGLAAAVAVPASAAVHSWLTHLPPLVDAGLAASPRVTGWQVLFVAAGAAGLAAVLLVPASQRRFARSGADLLLVAFAVVGYWQLTAQPSGSGARADVVRVAAPALLLTAGAAVALRVAVPFLTAADRVARRSRGLALPLAAFEAARRPHAVAAGLLISLACAAGTFGTAFDATWQRSQHDQADLSVGTDLALSVAAPPAPGDGAAVGAAAGGTVSPAINRGIAVGQWVGGGGAAPRLVALDTGRAASLLRGRSGKGRDWTHVSAGLVPVAPVVGAPVPAGLSISGTSTGAAPLLVTPRLLLQDGTGLRSSCSGDPFPLDGRPRPLPGCEGRLVAVFLSISSTAAPEPGPDGTDGFDASLSSVSVTLSVPGGPAPWTAFSAPPDPGLLTNPAVTATATGLTMTGDVQLYGPFDGARTLVATAFDDPGPVPVAVSARFASDLRVRAGSRLSLTVGTTPVPAVVTGVVPSVPGAPGAAALLADIDRLSRAVIRSGDPTFPMDAWWVGDPRADAAQRLADLHLGTVTTRAGEAARLTGSPPRAGLPAALRLLVPAAALLLFAGIALHVTFDLRSRALEVARLRGLGVSRREIRTVLLGQHAAVLLPPLLAGACVGALATWLVAPLMIRSDTGAEPVPEVVPQWPWGYEALLFAVLLAGCTIAVTVVAARQSRRADAAHLRVTT